MRPLVCRSLSAVASVSLFASFTVAQQSGQPVQLTADWGHSLRENVTVPTTQILAHAYTLRSSPIHDPLFQALRNLHTDDTRLQLWYSVANQAVLEPKEPTATKTFWTFEYSDPLMADFYANTSGKHHINMTTIPRWMFKVPPITFSSDPAASVYAYTDDTRGDLLKDPSGEQIAQYQARIFQWYTQGGFTDELGKFHKSGHHYKIDYWDVLNEPDFENKITVEQYTRIYDAVAAAIHKIDPHVEFYGPEVSGAEVPWAKYFLNMRNHRPGTLPIRWYTFHNYVDAKNEPDTWQEKYFAGPAKSDTDGSSAKVLVERTREVMKVRDELSPATQVILDETGTFDDVKDTEEACRAPEPYQAYKPLYWNAIGANWAYLFIASQRLGLPLFSMSQMIGYPTQCPSISMFDKDTARPNAHYWTLKLIHDHFTPGDHLVPTTVSSSDVEAQGSLTKAGRALLLVNTSNHPVSLHLGGEPSQGNWTADVVDEATGEHAPRHDTLPGAEITLAPFAVAALTQARR